MVEGYNSTFLLKEETWHLQSSISRDDVICDVLSKKLRSVAIKFGDVKRGVEIQVKTNKGKRDVFHVGWLLGKVYTS